jgi:hypothetical protein
MPSTPTSFAKAAKRPWRPKAAKARTKTALKTHIYQKIFQGKRVSTRTSHLGSEAPEARQRFKAGIV